MLDPAPVDGVGVWPGVERWVNVADARDPVAADTTVADEYEVSAGQKIRDVPVDNAQSPRHPHSGSGYLRVPVVQQVVLETVGNAFVQPVARTIIAKDLVDGAPGTVLHAVAKDVAQDAKSKLEAVSAVIELK